jgi:hypothetical protein
MVMGAGAQGYAGTLEGDWSLRCRMDGGGALGAGTGGSAAATDCPSITATAHAVAAGLHTIYVEWFAADSRIHLNAFDVAVFFRYK